MNAHKWHSGPPPSCGWWPASNSQSENIYRWWNGRVWSHCLSNGDSAKQVAEYANQVSGAQSLIEWKVRPKNWPARSMT